MACSLAQEEKVDSSTTGPASANMTVPETPAAFKEEDISASTSSAVAGKEIVRVDASVDKSVITIGEKIIYSVKIIYDKDLAIIPPEVATSLGGFAVKDFGRYKEKKIGKHMLESGVWYELDTYVVGSYIIPKLTVQARKNNGEVVSVTTPEIFLEVKSVVTDNEKFTDIRDIKKPVTIPFNRKILALVSIISLFVATGLGIALYWYFVVRRRQQPVIVILPHEAAYKELARIETLGLIERGEIKEYYFLLTACLRKYLEARFGLKALEQTTEEFVADIVARRVLDERYNELLRDFLYHCDFVKFANYDPAGEEIKKTYETVKRFIDETQPAPGTDGSIEQPTEAQT